METKGWSRVDDGSLVDNVPKGKGGGAKLTPTEWSLQYLELLRPDSYSGTLGQGSVGVGFMLAES